MRSTPSGSSKASSGLITAKVRTPPQADRWVRLIMAAYAQLLLARPLTGDLRRPWRKPPDPGSASQPPGTSAGGFGTSAVRSEPRHMSPNPGGPAPDAPKGAVSGPAPRYPIPKKSRIKDEPDGTPKKSRVKT